LRQGPLKLKLQFLCGEETAMGPGKADLLDAIDRAGSISAAGRLLGMSYRRTWLLVDEMNRCFRDRLVETLAGGGRERGARLTAAGRDVLDAYRRLEAAAAAATDTDAFRQLAGALLDAPRPVPAARQEAPPSSG
jgi:molybdate transport system regulatory protein